MSTRIGFLLICLAMLNVGCSSLSMTRKAMMNDKNVNHEMASKTDNQDSQPVEKQSQTTFSTSLGPGPARMAVIWKEKILNSPTAAPVRGFAGRIYFYDSDDQIMKVNGELIVYGYDDSQEFRSEVADSKYVFPADRFQEHYSESELGPAYSVWIPWENPDGFRKSVTLVPVFRTMDNHVLQGGTNRLTLSGKAPINATIEKTTIGKQAVPMNRNQPLQMAHGNSQQHLMQNQPQAHSIPIPRSISRRMTGAEQARYSASANRQLDQAMSAENNPNGEMFNRLNIQNYQSHFPNNNAPQQSGHMANFNDTVPAGHQNQAQPIDTFTPQNQYQMPPGAQPGIGTQQAMPNQHPVHSQQPIRVFGKPGPIR